MELCWMYLRPVLCKTYSMLPTAAVPGSIYYWLQVSVSPRNHTKSEDVSWKKMMLSITYAMASLEPHSAVQQQL